MVHTTLRRTAFLLSALLNLLLSLFARAPAQVLQTADITSIHRLEDPCERGRALSYSVRDTAAGHRYLEQAYPAAADSHAPGIFLLTIRGLRITLTITF